MADVIPFRTGGDPDPKSLTDFMKKFNRNCYVKGVGALTTVHLACPFCAAPEWLVHGLLDASRKLTAGAVCSRCFRGAKFVQTKTAQGLRTVLYQTVGNPPPVWMPDKPVKLLEHDHHDPQKTNATPSDADSQAPGNEIVSKEGVPGDTSNPGVRPDDDEAGDRLHTRAHEPAGSASVDDAADGGELGREPGKGKE